MVSDSFLFSWISDSQSKLITAFKLKENFLAVHICALYLGDLHTFASCEQVLKMQTLTCPGYCKIEMDAQQVALETKLLH